MSYMPLGAIFTPHQKTVFLADRMVKALGFMGHNTIFPPASGRSFLDANHALR
jgi:hypothetical protein